MKNLKAKSGPFLERPYYLDEEIESICVDELTKVGLCLQTPGPVRIDRFIEKKFSVTPTYADLGDGILGLTRFNKDGVDEIVVAEALDAENSLVAERRIRSTLAHEAGHALLHTHLFVLAPQAPLFGDASDPGHPTILCRGERGEAEAIAYTGQWWEFQANRAIGGLLLPKRLAAAALVPFLVEAGTLGLRSLDRSRFEEAARSLAEIFNVNPAVARIRINQIHPDQSSGQMAL